MITELLADPDDRLLADHIKHLSFSRINRYLTCPQQYWFYYLAGLRLKCPSASLYFGQIIHQALALYLTTQEDPVGFFLERWREVEALTLTYSKRETWAGLRKIGAALLELFVNEEASKLRNIEAVEQSFRLSVTSLNLPFVGIIDLMAEYGDLKTVIDFKTSAQSYEDHEVHLADQLTGYCLAKPEAEQAAICVLVKTKEPRIEWHLTTREGDQLTEFLVKAEYVASDIAASRFYKKAGKHCAWCDYRPICLRDKRKADETLVQIEIA